MPSVYDVKPAFQNLLRPQVRCLARAGISANQVTLAALGLSIAIGILVGCLAPSHRWIWAALPVWLLLRMALNAMDGMLAREHDQATPLGAILNELGDVLADMALYLPLALTGAFSLWPMALFVALAVASEMTGVVGIQIGASRRYDGPLGKSDRSLVFGILGALLALGLTPGMWCDIVIWALAVLSVATIVQRARMALRELSPAAGTR